VEAFGAGEVEIGFVDRSHFHDRRELAKDGGDAIAPERIFFVVAIEEYGMGAETARGAKRHGGVNTELAGFVTCGGNYAALIGTAPDDDGLAAKVGAIEELDGNEEGIHIDVEDGRVKRNVGIVAVKLLGAEAGEIRHGDRLRLWCFRRKVKVGRLTVGICAGE
jgi:hypothetical protein